jgi:hypothetical protein
VDGFWGQGFICSNASSSPDDDNNNEDDVKEMKVVVYMVRQRSCSWFSCSGTTLNLLKHLVVGTNCHPKEHGLAPAALATKRLEFQDSSCKFSGFFVMRHDDLPKRPAATPPYVLSGDNMMSSQSPRRYMSTTPY